MTLFQLVSISLKIFVLAKGSGLTCKPSPGEAQGSKTENLKPLELHNMTVSSENKARFFCRCHQNIKEHSIEYIKNSRLGSGQTAGPSGAIVKVLSLVSLARQPGLCRVQSTPSDMGSTENPRENTHGSWTMERTSVHLPLFSVPFSPHNTTRIDLRRHFYIHITENPEGTAKDLCF